MEEGRSDDGESGDDDDNELACVKRDESDGDWLARGWWSESGSWLQRESDAYQNKRYMILEEELAALMVEQRRQCVWLQL